MSFPGARVIVAVDGPAGSGKSTVSRLAAEKLGFLYLDTGAMYRAATWKVLNEGVNLNDKNAVSEIAGRMSIEFKDGRILVDGAYVTEQIREPEVTKNVYLLADVPEVRRAMVVQQRRLGGKGGIVAEGRDIGTIVFPDAEIKIYLDASVKERAGRRYRELKEKKFEVSLEKIEEEIAQRDYRDMNREIAPLRAAEGAVVLDTTNMGIEDVVNAILKIAINHE